MKDFKSYTPENSNGNQGSADFNNTAEFAKMITRAMNGKSEGQLLQSIIAEAARAKRDGTLTNADLDNFYNMVSPMVDGFKRKKLKEVVTRLKNI